jgi:hypothetical protein
MKKVSIDLRHCYGIKSLTATLDFSTQSAQAIYAPNGVMKSSFAQTFHDLSRSTASGIGTSKKRTDGAAHAESADENEYSVSRIVERVTAGASRSERKEGGRSGGMRYAANLPGFKRESTSPKRDLPWRRSSSCQLRSVCLDAPFETREPWRSWRDFYPALGICAPPAAQIPSSALPSSYLL